MYFPLRRTHTVTADWMSPLFAGLGLIILYLLNYHNASFCVLPALAEPTLDGCP